jgi:hypothetical protein
MINESSIKFFYNDDPKYFWGFKRENIHRHVKSEHAEKELHLTMSIPLTLEEILIVNQSYEIDKEMLKDMFHWFRDNGYLSE